MALGLLLAAFAILAALYASFLPKHGRFYDERFAFQNVNAVIQRGALEPANGYYATLSYLPQALALAAVDKVARARGIGSRIYGTEGAPRAEAAAHEAGAAFTPLAYRVARGIQVAWGVAALFFLVHLGRRCFDPPTALVAAAVLAACPWFVLAAGKFKPDASLLATTTLALWLSCRAVEGRSRIGRYLAAGVAVAAAMSCKLTGGLVAVPLAVVSAARARNQPRRLLHLAAAGALSLALFLLANPHLGLYRHFMARLTAEYADKALAYGGSRLGVVQRSLAMVVDETGLGWLFGSLSLAGFIAVGVLLLRRARDDRAAGRGDRVAGRGDRAACRDVVWLFPPVFLAAYAATTPHFKPNNVLSILPPLALFGAWAGVASWRRARRAIDRRSPRLARVVGALVALAVTAHLAARAWTYVVESTVPTSHDVAYNWLRTELGDRPVHIVADALPPERYRWEGTLLWRANHIARFPIEPELRRDPPVADGTFGDPEQVAGSPWATMAGSRTTRIEPAFLRIRGPTVAVAVTAWRRRDPPVEPGVRTIDGRLELVWPSGLLAGWYTVEVLLPPAEPARAEAGVAVGDQRLPLAWVRRIGGGHLFTSPRFAVPDATAAPIIAFDLATADDVAFALSRWTAPPRSPARRYLRRAIRSVGRKPPSAEPAPQANEVAAIDP